MTIDYRHLARTSLKKAKDLLNSTDVDHIRYAVLELRMAIEGLTYARANVYKDEIPPTEYKTWQPKKILELLIQIEPNVDQKRTISIGLEDVYAEPAKEMTTLGTEEIFSLQLIKKHYDALGSYLHLPTISQIEKNVSFDVFKVKARCAVIIVEIELVLSSKVFNTKFGNFSEMSCENCSQKIRKRLNAKKPIDEAVCFNCNVSYIIEANAISDNVIWKPNLEKIVCLNVDCNKETSVWRRDIKEGKVLECAFCKTRHLIGLATFLE